MRRESYARRRSAPMRGELLTTIGNLYDLHAVHQPYKFSQPVVSVRYYRAGTLLVHNLTGSRSALSRF